MLGGDLFLAFMVMKSHKIWGAEGAVSLEATSRRTETTCLPRALPSACCSLTP